MAVQFKDYYETLGVSKSATADEIRKAFRKLARQYHPDVAKDKGASEAKFKEINEAYEVLGDDEKRKKYDTLGADWQRGGGFQPPPGWEQQRGSGMPFEGGDFHFGGTGFSDFFEAFFGGAGARGAGARGFQGGFGGPPPQQMPRRGQDIEADIMVTLQEAMAGTKKTISFRRQGSPKADTYTVKIPAGVHAGQKIRLAGQGNPAPPGGEPGDLYLRVRFAQHPELRVEGSDLVYDAGLSPAQAVLGDEVEVPTLEGHARLKIPAGTSHGQRFRLKNQGLPKGGGARGDLYVVADLEIPKTISGDERKLWEKLAELGRS